MPLHLPEAMEGQGAKSQLGEDARMQPRSSPYQPGSLCNRLMQSVVFRSCYDLSDCPEVVTL
jgi:hypothetical protein